MSNTWALKALYRRYFKGPNTPYLGTWTLRVLFMITILVLGGVEQPPSLLSHSGAVGCEG